MKIVENESNDIELVDWFEEESKITGDEFKQLIPSCNTNTFDIQKINYLLGNVNICNRDYTNDLRTHYIINNKDLNIKTKLELLKDNYSNYWNLPEELLFNLAREKLGEKWDYDDIKNRRQKWLDKKHKEEQEDKQENKFQKELKKQIKNEPNFIIKKKTINF